MRFLITGGLGFIGRTLTQQLLEQGGHEIVIVDKLSQQVHGDAPNYDEIIQHPAVTFHHADICTPSVLRDVMEGVDVICHLAAETGTGQSMYEIKQYYNTNIMGTAILLEEMVKTPSLRPKHFLLSTSRSVYGEGAYVRADAASDPKATRYFPLGRSHADMTAGQFEFTQDGHPLVPTATLESDPVNPMSLYASSKLAQEQMCQIACRSVDVRFTGLRLQNVYGPGQSLRNPYTGIMSIFTNILRQNGIIDIFEDGEESRDFIYVGDVAAAFRACTGLAPEAPEIINIGEGKRTSVLQMVHELETKMGKPGSSKISGRFRPGDIRHCYADITLMQTVLGMSPQISLTTGLSRTVDWALTQPVEEDRSSAATRELDVLLKGKDS